MTTARRTRRKNPSTVARQKTGGRGGFSFLETLLATLILLLVAGVLSDVMTLGARYWREEMNTSRALLLLDTLCAVVRNDLACSSAGMFEYRRPGASSDASPAMTEIIRAPEFDSDGNLLRFATSVEEIRGFPTEYGVGEWQPDRALDGTDEDMGGWKEISQAERLGQIIRKSRTPTSQIYYTLLNSLEADSRRERAEERTPTDQMGVWMSVAGETKNGDRYRVTIEIYQLDGSARDALITRHTDGTHTVSNAKLLADRTFTVTPFSAF